MEGEDLRFDVLLGVLELSFVAQPAGVVLVAMVLFLVIPGVSKIIYNMSCILGQTVHILNNYLLTSQNLFLQPFLVLLEVVQHSANIITLITFVLHQTMVGAEVFSKTGHKIY